MSILSRFKHQGGEEKLLHILEGSDEKVRENMLAQMRHEDPIFTREVEKKILLWKNVFEFEQSALEEILKAVPPKTLALAFEGLDDSHKAILLKAIDRKTEIKFKDEIENLGRHKSEPTLVNTSRRKIIEVARKLEKDGTIKLHK